MRLKEMILKEKKLMEKYHHRFEKYAYTMPGIRFHPRRHRNCFRYYILEPGAQKETYLSWKKDKDLIKTLLERQNAQKKVKLTEENIAVLEQFLKSYHFRDEMFPTAECEEILMRGNRHFPVSQNPFRRYELVHDTGLGFFTRSKSEAIVARRLYAHGLYFEYERKLRIIDRNGNWKNIYPDFTIWLDDGRIIYLEHAGKLQDEDYMERFKNRLMDYHASDILISRNLFITVDGPKGDIDIEAIDALIAKL